MNVKVNIDQEWCQKEKLRNIDTIIVAMLIIEN